MLSTNLIWEEPKVHVHYCPGVFTGNYMISKAVHSVCWVLSAFHSAGYFSWRSVFSLFFFLYPLSCVFFFSICGNRNLAMFYSGGFQKGKILNRYKERRLRYGANSCLLSAGRETSWFNWNHVSVHLMKSSNACIQIFLLRQYMGFVSASSLETAACCFWKQFKFWILQHVCACECFMLRFSSERKALLSCSQNLGIKFGMCLSFWSCSSMLIEVRF